MISAVLENLPVDAPFVWGGGVLAVVLWALGVGLDARPAGRRLLRAVRIVENSFLALLLLTMILLSFLQVVLRNLAHAGFVWIDPLLRHLVLWVGFLGALLATRTGRHINIDALTRLLPPRAHRVAGVLTNCLAFVICLLVANACAKLMREEWLAQTHGFLGVPVWTLQLVMPLASFGMAVRFLGRAMQAFRGQLETGRSLDDNEDAVDAGRTT
jgi:TRAP-type C4-dicarboxylate transport system permease small subunit